MIVSAFIVLKKDFSPSNEMKKELEKKNIKTRHTAAMAAAENRHGVKSKALSVRKVPSEDDEGPVEEAVWQDALYRGVHDEDGNEIKDDPNDHIDHGSPVLYDEHGKELKPSAEDEQA